MRYQIPMLHRIGLVVGTVLTTLLLIMGAAYSAPLRVAIGSWMGTTNMPEPLSSLRSVSRGDAYVATIGGRKSNGSPTSAVRSAAIQADGTLGAWVNNPSLPAAVYLHAVAASDRWVYVIGGWDDAQFRSSVWRASLGDTGLSTWQEVRSYPYGVVLHDAVMVNNRIYVVGGQATSGGKSDVYSTLVDANGNLGAWSKVANLPKALYRHSVVATPNTLYVVGGYDGSNAQNNVYFATIRSDGTLASWSTTTLPRASYYHSVVIHDGRLVVMGGTNGQNEFSEVYSANIKSDGSLDPWQTEPSLLRTLFRSSSVAVHRNGSDYIIVIGGLSQNQYVNTVYHSAVPSTPTPPPTSTPTATATATPTPGLRTLVLRNDPVSAIQPGGEIIYSISYNNGAHALADFVISNAIPTGVALVPNSASPAATEDVNSLRWTIGNLAENATGRVSYRVRRPDNTPTSTPMPTITPTGTRTATPTVTSTSTRTPTLTVTRTTTHTPTSTFTATPTATATWTPTLTPTPPNLALQVSLTATPNPVPVDHTVRYIVLIVDTGNTGFSRIEVNDLYNHECMHITGAQSWPPSQTNPPNLVRWNNIGDLPPGGSKEFWIEFQADNTCSALVNVNTVTITGHLLNASVTEVKSLGVQIRRNDAVEDDRRSEPKVSYDLLQDVVITNSGATATWRHNGQPGQMTSNPVTNPSTLVYLPLMLHR